MRLLRDPDFGAFGQQHLDGNLQSPPGWVHDTNRPVSPLRSAKDLQASTTKRVKGVEDLNIGITCAQGIVGVGATIRTPISSYRAAASRQTASAGLPAGPASFSQSECSPGFTAGWFW